MERDDAILWLNGVVGEELDGEATLQETVAKAKEILSENISLAVSPLEHANAAIAMHELEFHVVPALKDDLNGIEFDAAGEGEGRSD